VSVSITLIGGTEVLGRLNTIFRGSEKAIKDALTKTAVLVMNDAKAGHPKVSDYITGKAAMPFRIRTGPTAGEFAGQPRFLTRTGELRNSIQMTPARQETFSRNIVATVFSGLEKADDVEFGTPKFPAYPFLFPALISNRGIGLALVRAAMRRFF